MGEYDKIFKSDATPQVDISPEEAVAAIAIVVSIADLSIDDIDSSLIADMLWDFEIFEEYSEDEMYEMVDGLITMAEEESVGALFNAANQNITEDVLLEGFAAGVMMLIDEEDLIIPNEKKPILKQLQEALELDNEEAQDVIAQVAQTFAEPQEDEFVEAQEEGNIYKSPSGNFEVFIPVESEEGGRIHTTDGLVTFSDDVGSLFRIDYYLIPEEQIQERNDLGTEKYLQSVLVDKYIPKVIVANLAKAKIEYTEFLEDTMDGAYFVLIDMPQGASLSKQENNGTASKLDAYRGSIAFVCSDFLYIVSSQRCFANGESPNLMEDEAESLKQKVLAFVDTIEFT
jgi:hypothetical protein